MKYAGKGGKRKLCVVYNWKIASFLVTCCDSKIHKSEI